MDRDDLDRNQVADSADGAAPQRLLARELFGEEEVRGPFCWLVRLGNRDAQQFSAATKSRLAMSMGEKAIVTNPHETRGQDVQEKSPDELRG